MPVHHHHHHIHAHAHTRVHTPTYAPTPTHTDTHAHLVLNVKSVDILELRVNEVSEVTASPAVHVFGRFLVR